MEERCVARVCKIQRFFGIQLQGGWFFEQFVVDGTVMDFEDRQNHCQT